ncbi:hypothetical protein HanPI659440_Chr10g0394171 [Helianthus annuus]|nr:hypothetical protein HanPI659440_Chr10g0394171 [Helianthus annuus]
MTRSSSSVAFLNISGFLKISEIAHSTVTAELSVPPASNTCVKALTPCLSSLTSRFGSSASCNNKSTISVATNFSPSAFRRALCSSKTCSKNRSNFLLTVFIRFTYPCRSMKSIHGIESPILNTPFNKNNSSNIFLNSSGLTTEFSVSSKYLFPNTILLITFKLTVDKRSFNRISCLEDLNIVFINEYVSSTRIYSYDSSRFALNNSITHILRACLQYAPYGDHVISE